MNLTDRIYVAVHIALTVLLCARPQAVQHRAAWVAWNAFVLAAIVLLARRQGAGIGWQAVHDWLPILLFSSVFEEVARLSLSLRGEWQNPHLIAFETRFFATSPLVWMHQNATQWLPEFLAFGYLAFYPLYPVVGGIFWGWRKRPAFAGAFRGLTDTLSVGYVVCYAAYLLFPVQSPANLLGVQQVATGGEGVFGAAVHLIQNRGGVHGNAFPSVHIMLAFVVLMYVYRYLPRVAPWLLAANLLMCGGAVYDGYHYASDVVAGALLGTVLGIAMVPGKAKPSAAGGPDLRKL